MGREVGGRRQVVCRHLPKRCGIRDPGDFSKWRLSYMSKDLRGRFAPPGSAAGKGLL